MWKPMQWVVQAIAVLPGLAVLNPATSRAHDVEVELTGTVHTTPRSGYSGSIVELGDPDSDSYALWALYSQERSDEPCWVQAWGEDINDITGDGQEIVSKCGPNGPSSSMLNPDFADGDFTGKRAFISGITVCMNNNQTKVKGMRLYGRSITEDGALVDLTNSALSTRLHCKDWQPRVNCPAGEIATAIEIHYAPGNEPRSWIGAALKCRAVVPA